MLMPQSHRYLSATFLSCVLLLSACGSEKESAAKEPAVRPVKLITLEQASTNGSNRYPAVIDAAESTNLTFEVSGLIEEILVDESQDINKGDVIAKLRQRDFRNNLDSAKAQFKNAEEEYQRALRLFKEDAIAKNVLEQRESQRDVAKSVLDTAKKALEDTVLRAPFSGVVASVPVKKLQTVQPGTTVASLLDLKTLEAIIDLPASIIATIEQRQDKRAFVFLDAAPNTSIDAEFKEASLIADSVSQTYRVTFSFPPPKDLLILPGMNATLVTQYLNEESDAQVALPLAAILSEGDQQFVWVVDTDTMQVSKREVELEQGIGDTLVVKNGLKPGETIAGAGANYLSEGIIVRAWE